MFRLLTVLLIATLSGVEVDLFVPAFPQLCQAFDLSPFMVQLTLSVNFVAYCLCSLFAGALGDRYNRRHVILTSLFLFVIGSALCVAAIHFPMLVFGRFLQGVGIAAPSVLAYSVIADDYSIDKQIGLMGVLNGVVTIAMAFAPTIGSYISLYFNWQGNFFILLVLGIICLVTSYFALPDRQKDESVSLSPIAYWPLLRSRSFLTFAGCIACLTVPYWVFIGFSPILYMQSLGVPLNHFGYYQGALASVFAALSLLSPKILARLGKQRCLSISMAICFVSALFIFTLSLLNVHNPLMITSAMLLLSTGVIFPINILFPMSINVIDNAKGRSTALIVAMRLILTGACLQIVGLFYNGTFLLVGIIITGFILLGLVFIRVILIKQQDSLNNTLEKIK